MFCYLFVHKKLNNYIILTCIKAYKMFDLLKILIIFNFLESKLYVVGINTLIYKNKKTIAKKIPYLIFS